MGRHGRRDEVKDNYTQKCEMAKRHETSWAQPSNEMANSPDTMLSQLSRNRKNGLFKTIHHGAIPNTIRGLLVVGEVLYQEVCHFLFP